MSSLTQKTQPQPQKKFAAPRWASLIVLLAFPVLTAFTAHPKQVGWTMPDQNAEKPVQVHAAVNYTATPTPKPEAAATPSPSTDVAAPGTTVQVTVNASKLREGPETSYPEVAEIALGDELLLLGRLSDDAWLYVETAGGVKGWIKTVLVNVSGVTLEDYPILTSSETEKTVVKVVGGTVNMRSGPHLNFNTIDTLRYGDMVTLLGRLSDNVWINVETSSGNQGWIYTSLVSLHGININYYPEIPSPPVPQKTPEPVEGAKGRWIDIDISEQRLYAFEDDQVVKSFLVSTGIAGYNTERGQFRIDVKYRFDDMAGAGYNLKDVPYSMYYYESYAIHGTYWHRNFGTQMSHGCVNMDTDDAKWLYYWASVGTLVNIHW
ncbi:MAG: L,D-transpeptidase family protein [Anaerolineaceae bacterium]|nr:L,D-transpeptidase family protein [Anaerolineaceae bacterium]